MAVPDVLCKTQRDGQGSGDGQQEAAGGSAWLVTGAGQAQPSKELPPHPLLHPPQLAPPWGTPPGPCQSPAGERQEERLGETEHLWTPHPTSLTVPGSRVEAPWDPPPPRSIRRGRRCGRAGRTAGTPLACSALSPTAGCCPWGCSCPEERGQSQGVPMLLLVPLAHSLGEKRSLLPCLPLPSWMVLGVKARSPLVGKNNPRDRRGQGQPHRQDGGDQERQWFLQVFDLEVIRGSRIGWRRGWWGLAGTWWWHPGEERPFILSSTSLVP